ncbi:dephospho-CoA kinase [Nitrosomonas sp. Nm166]|uniref:dephospho-CoA kinase n=1 Tax=Nitrosomonas sp. Nm166 TaxID=1881054 RepID=UPI0008F17F79|nr:dephospho-CoA kinase [Nitrosomonas sp. Nm166]SFE43313.1 dephospho-CoA kinase [Nitrosomonas sp. Nm166]
MTFIVGLTGGIGCGKSSASRFFSDFGIDVIDTDLIAQKLTQSGGSAISMIRDTFGNAFVTADNALDRNKMRNLIFSDSDARLKLEKILHPLILKETSLQIKQTRSLYIIIAVPLLLETNDYNDIIQRILVIDCDEQQQLSRTMTRSQLSEQMVKAIIAAQIPRRIRLQKADDIIINNQDIDQLKAQILHLHHKYLTLSKRETSSLKN